jgi:hypothetical protein
MSVLTVTCAVCGEQHVVKTRREYGDAEEIHRRRCGIEQLVIDDEDIDRVLDLPPG